MPAWLTRLVSCGWKSSSRQETKTSAGTISSKVSLGVSSSSAVPAAAPISEGTQSRMIRARCELTSSE